MNSVSHQYVYISGSTSLTINVDLSTSSSSGGSANKKNATPADWKWWWDADIDQIDPRYVFWDAAEGEWGEPSEFSSTEKSADTNGGIEAEGRFGAGGEANTVTATSASGTFEASKAWAVPPSQKVAIAVEFESMAHDADVKNAKITAENFARLEFEYETWVSSP